MLCEYSKFRIELNSYLVFDSIRNWRNYSKFSNTYLTVPGRLTCDLFVLCQPQATALTCRWTRVLHGTSYAIPHPPVPASNSPAPVPLPPVWVPLPYIYVPIPSWSRRHWTELTPSRRDSLNFTTPKTADRCPRGGGCLLKCKPAWSLYSVSSVWHGESGKWQSGNSGCSIDTSVCSLSITHVARTRRRGGSSRDKP